MPLARFFQPCDETAMKKFFLFQTLLTVLGPLLLLFLHGWRVAASFGLGALVILVNVALMAWAWNRILRKKLVALALSLIVFKYAILGAILYQILKTPWVSALWFCAGIGTLMLAAMGAALSGENVDEQGTNPAPGSP